VHWNLIHCIQIAAAVEVDVAVAIAVAADAFAAAAAAAVAICMQLICQAATVANLCNLCAAFIAAIKSN